MAYDYKGQTKSKGVRTYYKFGIYRSWISKYKSYHKGKKVPTQVVYFDEVRKGSEVKRPTFKFLANYSGLTPRCIQKQTSSVKLAIINYRRHQLQKFTNRSLLGVLLKRGHLF